MYQYIIALGSNQRHVRYDRPRAVLVAAINKLASSGGKVIASSQIIRSRPIGPSNRRYANAAIILETAAEPLALLHKLKEIESGFGRRRGQQWSRRVLDLDIILYSAGVFDDPAGMLTIPHIQMRNRSFVLTPAAAIAPDWRDPISGLTLRQMSHRLKHGKISTKPA